MCSIITYCETLIFLSGFTKLGRISGKTLRGWLRHAMEKLLLKNGVSVCHPLPANTVTNERNKKYYEDDALLGYHPRGACKKQGGCPVYHIFGDLDKPSNIIVSPIYFYPSLGGGTLSKNFQKITGQIGLGRVEIDRESPRKRSDTFQTYMSQETIMGTYINAPWTIIIRNDDEFHEVLIFKTLEFLFEKNQNWDFDFMIGGQRTAGCGKANVVRVNSNNNFLTKNRNIIGITQEEAELISEKFNKYIAELKENFPIKSIKKAEKITSKGKKNEK